MRDTNPGCLTIGSQPCEAGSVVPPIQPHNLFFGNAHFDPQPDWIDFSKIAIPQADEQQRFLANLILRMNANRKPLPRFWYFPHGKKAVVVMTGDGHTGSKPAAHFDKFIAMSPAGCSLANWECVRSTAFIYSVSSLTNSQAATYTADGFEVSIHLDTDCANWTTQATLHFFYLNQLADWEIKYTGVPPPVTNRTHCIVWSDYTSQAEVEFRSGMRLDTSYYYYPGTWVQDRPGFFTGSGMPMRFAKRDGSTIDVYQAATQMTDQSFQTFPFTIDSLLDRAIGPDGYYGAFTANMHVDHKPAPASEAIVASALARGVPVVSAKQMLTWLDGRNASSFRNLTWNNETLDFEIVASADAIGIQAMLPIISNQSQLVNIMRNGSTVPSTKETIKGIEYAVFDAQPGSYSASYETRLNLN